MPPKVSFGRAGKRSRPKVLIGRAAQIETLPTQSPPRLKRYWLAAIPAIALLAACQQSGLGAFPTELDQFASGGDATNYDETSAAYSLPAANLRPEDIGRHIAGDMAFESQFVSAPAPVNPGLGPAFNNNSCVACHRGDGGGKPPEDGASSNTLLMRLSVPGVAPDGGPNPVPGFGGQLQDQAIFGSKAEARALTRYTPVTGAFADGTPFVLRRPTIALSDPHQALPDGVMISPRMSSPVFGLGLLEAVPETAIVQLADEDDRNGDGISGRPNRVWNIETGAPALGRFGWKANTPSLFQQVAAAYHQDMGVTSPAYPDEASGIASTGETEIDDVTLRATVFYVKSLGAPARRDVADPLVRRGATLFREASCATCHAPTLSTGASPELPALAHQVIHPYTDMLLHDLGPGLSDARPDFRASAQEWRTAPLWGIGLRKRVQGHDAMLHDGRARGVQEAILWHDGEARPARERFVAMTVAEREALIAFLGSL